MHTPKEENDLRNMFAAAVFPAVYARRISEVESPDPFDGAITLHDMAGECFDLACIMVSEAVAFSEVEGPMPSTLDALKAMVEVALRHRGVEDYGQHDRDAILAAQAVIHAAEE